MNLFFLKNSFWKVSVRNLLKNQTTSLISISGLVLGFTAFIIIGLFIKYEFSWDKTNEHYERIYRVQRYYSKTSFAMDGNDISPHSNALTASLLEVYPEVEKATVIRENLGKFISSDTQNQFYDETSICADTNFFSVFTYPFVQGSATNALNEPFSIVLSETMAQKLFGSELALGKTVSLEKKFDLNVTGVYRDLPMNSTLRPEYIVSFSTLERTAGIKRDNSFTGDCMTFLLLKPGVDAKSFESKIKNTFAEFKGLELQELQLCPMKLLHINFNNRPDLYIILGMFGVIGLFILVMSAFNYINLTIANASTRGKEVAIKKITGSNRGALVIQFLGESLIMVILASVLALLLAKMLLPIYNTIVNSAIEFDFLKQWPFVIAYAGIALFVGIISGIYPAFIVSSHCVNDLFNKGLFKQGKNRINIRHVLVSLQFAISVTLVCISLLFLFQINYMTNKNLGFDKENLIYVNITSSVTGKYFDDLRNRLLQNPEIIDASMSKNLPFVSLGGGMIDWEGAAPDEKISYRPNQISYDFVSTMGISIVEGRNFSREISTDVESACLINESALRCFNWDNPIGKRVNNNQWTVVGVVKDYIYKDMHNGVEPAVLRLTSGEMNGDWSFAIRYTAGSREKVTSILKNEFLSLFPNDPFEFHTMADAFQNEKTIKIYQTIKRSILFYTVFNIFLAIIGLYGLVRFTTLRRTKEIGVRKINGGSIGEIFLLLNKEFFILLGLSLLLAWPLSWLSYDALPGAYKISIETWAWLPLIATFISMVIVLLTTSYQTLKAATRKPVEALRYE